VLVRCRAGLEPLLAEELPPALAPRLAGAGMVRARLAGPLEELWRARTMLRFTLPLPLLRIEPGADDAVAVARALAAPAPRAALRELTEGPVRLRLEWVGAGHRRAATYRFARELERLAPELINDPARSDWELIVSPAGGGRGRALQLELWPRGLPDPRFAYRRRDVPAASHPTIAAALARVAGVRPDDVVWDPFVGSATELVERALLGPYEALYGTDLDEGALAAARENLGAAAVERWELGCADARGHAPPRPPTLILTNPPMGKRVLQAREVLPLYRDCLRSFAALLAPHGRLVWISPLFDKTVAIGREHGLRPTLRRRLDMGGFAAELQVLVKGI
jgi:precorrin-6B methylase 2